MSRIKNRWSMVCGVAAAVMAFSCVSAEAAFVSESFDTGSSVDSNVDFYGSLDTTVTSSTSSDGIFSVNRTSNNNWIYASTGGVNSTGRLQAPNGQAAAGAVHNTGIAGFATHPTISYQMDVRILSTGSVAFGGMNFDAYLRTETTPGTTTSALTSLGFRLLFQRSGADPSFVNEYVINSINGNAFAEIGRFATSDLTHLNWYRWDSTFTLEADDTLTMTLSLYDLGTSGTSTPVLYDSWMASDLSNNAFADAATLYAGFNGRARDNLLIDRIDNFTVIPEPASLALLVLGGLLMASRRRG